MKHCLVTLAALLVAASTYAQGTVLFANKVGTINAPVTYLGSTPPSMADGQFVAQLYAGPTAATMAAVGDPIPFRSDAGKGYWVGTTRTITTVAAGSPAQVKVVAWASALGATYEAALGKGQGGIGNSSTFEVATGGAGSPPSLAANLNGLTAFSISTIVPEPSIAALGLLGAGMLLIRRKK